MSRSLWVLVIPLASVLLPAASFAVEPSYQAEAARVQALSSRAKPSKPEAWTTIPWVGSLTEAHAASRREQCPIFLFHLLGDMTRNRC